MTWKWIAGGVLAAALIGGGTALAIAGSADGDPPLTGSTLEKAGVAALEATGGGTVVGTEIGDGGEAYEVDVSLEDGRRVEVSLDESFQVIGTEADDVESADDDGPGED